MSRYVLTDADVILEVTEQQARILSYVLRRAQEDPGFFDDLAGSSNTGVKGMLHAALAAAIKQLNAPIAA